MSFERAQAIADAVLFEGYVLYPYRATSTKNRYRWTFGVLAPSRWSMAGGCETWWLEAQLLVASITPRIHGRLRFLRVIDRTIEVDGQETARLEVDGEVFVPWEEGELREIDFDLETSTSVPFTIEAQIDREPIVDPTGKAVGVTVRKRGELRGRLHTQVEILSESPPLARVSIRVQNLTPFSAGADRAQTMRASLISTHLLVCSTDGDFLSLHDPPQGAREFVERTKNVGTYPVLVGEKEQRDLVLCAPIILEEHPRIAPESPGDFFDSGEIDEILALRTKLLTPEEKSLARATDARTAALLDRVEGLDDQTLARLHGAIRDRPTDRPYAPGARVRLRLGRSGRRTDAQDLLYDGHTATVEQVLDDVDGRQYLSVTVDDDPAADLHRWYGRFHQYYLDEVEPLVRPLENAEQRPVASHATPPIEEETRA